MRPSPGAGPATDRPELATGRPELANDRPELATGRPELANDRPELATDGPDPSGRVPQPASPDPSPDWRAWEDAALQRQYTPSSCIGGDWRPYLEAYRRASAQARLGLCCRAGLRYGPGFDERLDFFRASALAGRGEGAPLVVYFHGGYWQELSPRVSVFAAPGFVRDGWAFAAVGYGLAPRVPLARIVGRCRRALAWIWQRAEALGVDRRRILLAGSSAGAHLAAMCLHPPSLIEAGLPPDAVAAAALVSGIYDLRPLVRTDINDALGLDEATAWALSPQRLSWPRAARALVAWGAVETDEFVRQSRSFARHLARQGVRCDAIELPGRNHFDAILDLSDPATPLGGAVRRLLEEPRPLA